MDSSLRRGSLKIRPRKIIYDGSKTIRKADSLIELVIAHHFKDNCVELVVRDSNNISSDNEVGRIYFDYEKLSQQIDSLRFKRAFEKKMEAFRAQGIETNVDDAATVVMNELLVEYLLAHVSADVDNSNNINSNNSNSNVYPIVHINKITSSMNLLNSISTVTNTITSSIGQTPQVSELIIIINIASNHSLVIESPPIPLTEVYKRIEQRLVSVDNTIIHTSTSNDNSEETTSIIDAILLKPPDTISPLDVTQYRRRKSLTSGEGMDGVRSRVPSMAVTDKDDKHSRGVTNENIARNNSTDNIPIVSPADQMESEVLKDSTGSSINKVEKSSNSEEKVEETVVNSDNNKETESDSLALPPISPRPDGGSTKVNGIGFNATPRSGKTMITPVSGSGKRLISPSITSGKVSASAGSLPKISANSSNYYKDSSPGTENKAGNRRRSFPFNFRPKTSDSKNANGVKTTNKEGNSGPKSSTGRSLQTKDEIQNAQQIAKDAIDNASNLSAGDETKRRHSLSSTPVLPKLETPKYSERTKVSTEPVSVVSKNENVDLECDAGQTVDQAVAKQINSVGVGAVNVAGSERKDQYINIEETAVNEEAIARESVASVAGPSTSTRNEEVKTEQVDSVENRKDVEGMASTTVSSTSQEVMKNVTEGEML